MPFGCTLIIEFVVFHMLVDFPLPLLGYVFRYLRQMLFPRSLVLSSAIKISILVTPAQSPLVGQNMDTTLLYIKVCIRLKSSRVLIVAIELVS